MFMLAFARKSRGSVIPGDWNIFLNPAHREFHRLQPVPSLAYDLKSVLQKQLPYKPPKRFEVIGNDDRAFLHGNLTRSNTPMGRPEQRRKIPLDSTRERGVATVCKQNPPQNWVIRSLQSLALGSSLLMDTKVMIYKALIGPA